MSPISLTGETNSQLLDVATTMKDWENRISLSASIV